MLHQALSRLTVEDPYLEYQHDQYANEHTVRVFGRVQQEVLAETIREQYGIQVTFSPPKVLCIEKPAGVGESAEMMGDPGNLFWYRRFQSRAGNIRQRDHLFLGG